MNFKLSINNSCQRMLAFFVTATVAAVFMMVSMVHAATWWVDGDVATSQETGQPWPLRLRQLTRASLRPVRETWSM